MSVSAGVLDSALLAETVLRQRDRVLVQVEARLKCRRDGALVVAFLVCVLRGGLLVAGAIRETEPGVGRNAPDGIREDVASRIRERPRAVCKNRAGKGAWYSGLPQIAY